MTEYSPTDDLHHSEPLSPERRALRAKILAELPRRETGMARHTRERDEAKQQAAKVPHAEAWANWFRQNFAALWAELVPQLEEAIGQVIAHERRGMRRYVAEQLANHPGTFPPIKAWQPEITKQGALVSFDGAVWQSREDTAQRPSIEASQWSLIVYSERALGNWGENAMCRALHDEMEVLRNELAAAKLEIKSRTEAVSEAIATERSHGRGEVAKELSELRSALEEAITAERGARRDEVAKTILELRSNLEAMDKAMASERRAQRDEIARLREELLQLRAETEAKRAALKERMEEISGKLPIAKAWAPESVTYQGAFAVHDGACWQALHDTAQRPGGCDWVCVARAGRDGADGLTPNICGVYDASRAYARLDVVTYEGASYIARRDAPGLPVEDPAWQLLAAHGAKGERGASGPRGSKGDKGQTGAMIRSWQVDRKRFRASPLMSNGTVGAMLELRSLFEEYQAQTS